MTDAERQRRSRLELVKRGGAAKTWRLETGDLEHLRAIMAGAKIQREADAVSWALQVAATALRNGLVRIG